MREEGLILVDVNTLPDGEPRNNFLKRALTWNAGGVLNGARHITLGGHYAYVATPTRASSIVDLDDPLQAAAGRRRCRSTDARASALQFRYLFVTDADGLQVIDVTDPEAAARRARAARMPLADAQPRLRRAHLCLRRRRQRRPGDRRRREARAAALYQTFNAGGTAERCARRRSSRSTNASLFAYVADGKNGLKVMQLTSPDTQPKFYGFSPEPKPQLIASYRPASRRCACRAAWSATAPWTRPAARSRCSAASARGRSTCRRCRSCTWTPTASRGT